MGRSRAHVVLFVVTSATLFGQTVNPLTEIVKERFERLRLDVAESAEAMPEAKYTFRLTDGQRTFGEWIAHIASSNYSACSVIKGEKLPDRARPVAKLKTKSDLVAAVKDSLAYCADALAGMTDQSALAPAGPAQTPPVRGMVNLVSSCNEHYGNIVGYLRANNIVPPSTARAGQQKRAKK